jgi:hypothetical protein
MAGGTLNLYPGAYVNESIYALGGSTVNIYGGELGTTITGVIYLISIFPGDENTGVPDAVVTVYGTKFAVDGVDVPDGTTEFTVNLFSGGVLTGDYGNNGGSINLKFFSGSSKRIPIYLVNLDTDTDDVEIDIKPGSDENVINLKSRGVVPVAVLTTDGFTASNINPDTVEFAGASPVHTTLCDVDEDGDMDMLFHFRTQELDLEETDKTATLTATLKSAATKSSAVTAGDVIQGIDKVKIKSSRKN